jgi:DNA recombination protein RmuC
MNQESILIGLIALAAGIFVTRLILKSSTVQRDKYDNLKDDLASTRNELDTKFAVEKELRKTIDDINSKVVKDQEIHRTQENNLASLRATISSLQERFSEERSTNLKQQENIGASNDRILFLKSELAKVEVEKTALEQKVGKQFEEFEESRKKSLFEFENIANKLFDEKTTKFSKQSIENIEQLLNPLKENLKDFKKKVEETYDKESKERFSLENKITELVALNQQISKDATNLTNALKGQSKTQGDWGEMILESILEYSGLVKNRQYFVQESFIDEKGKRKQPDVIIKYPDNRYVIIDSKVSLVAYEQFANSEDIDNQKIHLNSHIKSIKNHIDNLSSKEYEQLDKALDFVFLFIPIEPAFLTALQYDSQLWNYAYSKRIVLMSPTNLIATLRVIVDVWSKEIQNNNAREISKRGEKLFDKFVGFVTDMEDIDKHLGKASEKYGEAIKKLSTGRGNLIGQAENLKTLGVNSKKRLPEKFLIDNIELGDEPQNNEATTLTNNDVDDDDS